MNDPVPQPEPLPPQPDYPPQPEPLIDNGGDILPPPPILPPLDPIDKDFDCICLGKKLVNVAPKIIFAFIITLIVLGFAIVFVSSHSDSLSIFLPVITGLVGFWIPSPLQSSSRKDAITTETLLQAHLQNSRMFTAARYGQVMRQAARRPQMQQQQYRGYNNV